MVAVANSTGVFHTFGYNFDDPNGHIQQLSTDTQEHLDRMPPFITEWQAQDIANNDFGGYYQNPMQSVTMNIIQSANAIYMSSNNVANLTSMRAASHGLEANAYLFLSHTNKQSGVTEFDGSDISTPYLNQAIGAGRTALYITNQTDGITDNSPIMGNFTSILIEDDLNSLYSNISGYYTTISNSITITGTGISPDNYVRTSNLSLVTVQTIANNISSINTLLSVRRDHDEKFYTNSKTIVNEYAQLRIFSSPGATANNLLQNYIGSDKLLTRLNS